MVCPNGGRSKDRRRDAAHPAAEVENRYSICINDLIKALTILRKYGNPRNPTHCQHDVLIICGIEPSDVSAKDKKALEKLGFFVSTEFGEEHFRSFRFGSA